MKKLLATCSLLALIGMSATSFAEPIDLSIGQSSSQVGTTATDSSTTSVIPVTPVASPPPATTTSPVNTQSSTSNQTSQPPLIPAATAVSANPSAASASTTLVYGSNTSTAGLPSSYATNSRAGYWGSNPQGNGDCSPSVAQQQDLMRKASLADANALANRNYSQLPPGGYTGVACIDSLLNSQFNIFGNFPLSDLLGMLEQGACNALTSMVSYGANYALSPLNQQLNQALPIGQLIPGVDLGSISGGMLISPNIGGAGSPGGVNLGIGGSAAGVPVNVRTMFDPNTGQMNNQPGYNVVNTGQLPPSYGMLFGRSPAMSGYNR